MRAFRLFKEPDDKAIRCAFRFLLALTGVALLLFLSGPLLIWVLRDRIPHTRQSAFRLIFIVPVPMALALAMGAVGGWQLGKVLDKRTSPGFRLNAYYAGEVLFVIVCLKGVLVLIRLIWRIGRIDLFSALPLIASIGLVVAAYQGFSPIRKIILETVHDP